LFRRFDEIPLLAKDKLSYYTDDSLQYIASSNQPLRAEKGTIFEGGIRVPFIVKWPGKTKAGTRSDATISSIDLFPTFLQMAGGEQLSSQVVDGKSMVPILVGEQSEMDRAVFWHYPVYHHATPASAVRKGDYKLIHFLEKDQVELYNLETDLGERINLSTKLPEKTAELLALLNNWRQEVNAAMPIKNTAFDEKRRREWARHPAFDLMLQGSTNAED
jgi:uncharacterized sulfatase